MPDLSDGLEPFDPYVNASTVAQRWQVWVRRARNFLLAKGITDPSRQRAMFLYKAGRHVEELYYQLSPEDPQLPSRPPDDVASEDHDAYAAALASYEIAMANLFESAVKLLSDHFNPQRNSMHEREIFFSLKLENNETIGSFVQRLQAQAEHCYFISEMQQEMIRDRLYACCPWPDLKLSMLKAAVAAPTNTPFSLETALTMATAFEKLLPVEAPVSIVTDVNHRTFTDGNCLTISSVCGVMASIIGLLFRCGMKHLGVQMEKKKQNKAQTTLNRTR